MNIQESNYPVPISTDLIKILNKEISDSGKSSNVALYINFRDPKYSQDSGGFHPVEIMISSIGVIEYITDFAYTGYPAELVKEIDFDFAAGVLQHFGNEYLINQSISLFMLWEINFCAYYNMGVYDIEITEVL